MPKPKTVPSRGTPSTTTPAPPKTKGRARPATVVNRLARAIKEVLGDDLSRDLSVLKAGEADYLGGTSHKGAIYGEGLPFEWTMITVWASIYAGELENYSSPVEEPIRLALEFAEENGYYFENLTSWALTLYDA